MEVTARDIRRGTRDSSTSCPVALACKRASGVNWYVDSWTLDNYSTGETIQVKTPKRVAKFVFAFDSLKPVKPFSFTLNVPKSAVRKSKGGAR